MTNRDAEIMWRVKLRLERRKRREGAKRAYALACKLDLNRRPPHVSARALRRATRASVAAHPKGALFRAAEHRILLARIRVGLAG